MARLTAKCGCVHVGDSTIGGNPENHHIQNTCHSNEQKRITDLGRFEIDFGVDGGQLACGAQSPTPQENTDGN
jgi:hypothetical protein